MQYFVLFIWTALLSLSGTYLAQSREVSVFGKDYHKEEVRTVTATGRSIIQHEDALEEARMLSLEDALYYAALKGGVKIEGFSSVDATTSLTDMTVIRPVTQILDYKVISEISDGIHYELTIEAMVGDRQTSGCQSRPMSHVTLFKPVLVVDPSLPGYLSQSPAHMSHTLTDELSIKPHLSVIDLRHLTRQKAGLSKATSTTDYRSLTSGRARMYKGDFGVNSTISLRAEKEQKVLASVDFAVIDIVSEVFIYGETGVLTQIANSERIQLGQKSPVRALSVLTRTDRETLHALVTNVASAHAAQLSELLRCTPLETQLLPAKAGLMVSRGSRHGIQIEHLAFARGTDTPLTILHVTEVSDSTAMLKPLDNRHDLKSLYGAMATFQEFD